MHDHALIEAPLGFCGIWDGHTRRYICGKLRMPLPRAHFLIYSGDKVTMLRAYALVNMCRPLKVSCVLA